MPDIDSAVRTFAAQQAAVKQAQEYQYPPSDSPTLALVPPTATEIRQQQKANAASWRGALSMDSYLRREEFLAATDLAKDSGLSHWVLIDTAVPEGYREVLAGCESLCKEGLVVRAGGNGQIEESIVHCVGSVFTPDRFRGKGYGARMIHELSQVLKFWQTDVTGKPSLFSVLYSDIGKKFYAKHGWKPHVSSHINLPIVQVHTELFANGEAKSLTSADIPALCSTDEALQRQQLISHSRANPSHHTAALVPNLDTIEWHHARENFISNELYSKTPTIKGAIVTLPLAQGETTPTRVWAIWKRVWNNPNISSREDNTLHILRLVVDSEATRRGDIDRPQDEALVEAIAAVLQVAQQQAHEWNMENMELWNPQDASVREACKRIDPEMGTRVVNREETSIGSLKWYGGGDTDDVEWLENEKYGWC